MLPESEPAFEVLETREIDPQGGVALGLSPDGRWLAVEGADDELCVTAVDNPDSPARCGTIDGQVVPALGFGRLRETDLAWSPDRTRLAFMDNGGPFTDEEDADIWVMEVATGALTNLTDDGFADKIRCERVVGQEAWIDLFHAWSPDSQTLAFLRTGFPAECPAEGSGAVGTTLYAVSVVGGPALPLATIADEPYAVPSNPVWTPDGERILYAFDRTVADAPDPRNGLWEVRVDGTEQRRVLAADPERGNPVPLEVRPQGDLALVRYENGPAVSQFELPPTVALVDLASAAADLLPALADAPDPSVVLAATFSPDGSRILTAENRGSTPVLTVRDVAMPTGQVLFEVEGADHSLRPRWTAGNQIFMRRSAGPGILLRLSESGPGRDGTPALASPVAQMPSVSARADHARGGSPSCLATAWIEGTAAYGRRG